MSSVLNEADRTSCLFCRRSIDSVVAGDNRRAIAAAGGIVAVIAAMTAHPGNAMLQRDGCKALANLAADGERIVNALAFLF